MEIWACVIDWIGNEYSDYIVAIIQKHCRQTNRSLIVFTLGDISYKMEEKTLENQFLPFLKNPYIDRYFFCSAQLVRGKGGAHLAGVLKKAPPKPSVCLEGFIPGFPLVTSSIEKGYRELMDHLWEDHGYRNFAWISGPRGNPDAENRRRVFLDFLASKGTSLPFHLEYLGDFNHETGSEGANALKPYLSQIDVIMAANDAMAMGAWETLDGSVPVVGFDNYPLAREIGMTTLEPGLYGQVVKAIQFLETCSVGQDTPEPLVTQAHMVIRQSCGCISWISDDNSHKEVLFGNSTDKVGEFFENIIIARDMSELNHSLNRVMFHKNIGSWDIWPSLEERDRGSNILNLDSLNLRSQRGEVVIHSLFRDQDVFGYLVHDLSKQNYTLSEWVRSSISLTFQRWHKQSRQSHGLLNVEMDKLAKRQNEVSAVINSLPLWIFELDSRLNVRYRSTPERFEPLLIEEGRSFLHSLFEPHRDRVEELLVQARERASSLSLDFSLLDHRGREVPVIGSIQPLKIDGSTNVSGIMGAIQGSSIRLVLMSLKPLIDDIQQPEDLLMKHIEFSKREKQVIQLLAQGKTSPQIGKLLGISESTVRVQLHHIYHKSGVSSKCEFIELLAEYNGRAAAPNSLTQLLLSRMF